MKSHYFLTACTALLLSACASQAPNSVSADNSPTTSQHSPASAALPSAVKLPANATWRCTDGSELQTRLSGNNLQLRYQGRDYQLSQAPSARPAIYENAQIAFFSDGQSAAVGNPQSANVLSSGCRLGGKS